MFRSQVAVRVAVLCLVLAGGWCQAQDLPGAFGEWSGGQVPEGLPLIEPALGAGRAIVLHFTGDAGPDNVAQTITLNDLRGRYGNDVIFLRAEDETAAGDRLFDAFGAARIPSVMVLDATGHIVAVFEGLTDAAPLAAAIDEAKAASPAPSGSLSVYELSNPLPSPKLRVDHPAPASTPAIHSALESGRATLLAFLGSYSRFNTEQEEVLRQLEGALEGLAALVVSADEPANAAAFSDYRVTGVPTLFVLSADGVVRAHFDGLTELTPLAAACADALARPDAPPREPEIVEPPAAEPEPPVNALAPHVPGEPGADLEVGPPRSRDKADPPLPRGPFIDDSPPAPRDLIAATGGDPGNPLSPAAGAELAVDSAANADYGPSRLVDGLTSGDAAFRPWVSSAGHDLPIEIRIRPGRADITALVLHPATGARALFGSRWPKTVEVLLGTPDGAEPRSLGRYELPADGSAFTIDLPDGGVPAIVVRILATHGGSGACEMAEITAR